MVSVSAMVTVTTFSSLVRASTSSAQSHTTRAKVTLTANMMAHKIRVLRKWGIPKSPVPFFFMGGRPDFFRRLWRRVGLGSASSWISSPSP